MVIKINGDFSLNVGISTIRSFHLLIKMQLFTHVHFIIIIIINYQFKSSDLNSNKSIWAMVKNTWNFFFLNQRCLDENASFLLLSNLLSRSHHWYLGNQQGMSVAGFLSLYIYTADAIHVKVVLGIGNCTPGSYVWWSLNQIIAVTSLCPNAQCTCTIIANAQSNL